MQEGVWQVPSPEAGAGVDRAHGHVRADGGGAQVRRTDGVEERPEVPGQDPVAEPQAPGLQVVDPLRIGPPSLAFKTRIYYLYVNTNYPST